MTRLDQLDLTLRMSKDESQRRLDALQRHLLHLRLFSAGLVDSTGIGPPLLVVFEGWDASGKGGAIKRLVARLDPRQVAVAQFAAPNDEEHRHHFLWRFFRELPGWGEMGVFDRTWYGRVLVERVEGFASTKEWQRAYDEIVNFEHSMAEEGTVLVKFWLHISSQEQLKRFESRASDPLRKWKLTDDDWRNRAKRPAYEEAVEEMLERTDHPKARWNLIEAENKHYARVKVLSTVIASFEEGLRQAGLNPPKSVGADFDPLR